MTSPLATLPSVDAVTRRPAAEALRELYGRPALVAAVRLAVADARARLGDGGRNLPADPGGVILAAAAEILAERDQPAVRPVFNLTGTVLHTNLGRAWLPETAIEAVRLAAQGASSLEYDLETGRRGERERGVEARLCRLTGAEAATFVNNNAAAVLLTLNSLALRREVPVSRGELIEIGGAFRMPDIMARAGCRLREVGTTNRTRLSDYAEAIGPRTALLMKVHPSNYVISGFTEQVPERALSGLAQDRGLPLVTDLGSGALVDLARYGLPSEPTPSAMLTDGADLVTFSGDKLLGGPQAGLIVGRRDLVEKLRRNPLKRALRLDKMTLAALDAVLRLYENPDRLPERLPALRLLTRPVEEIAAQAERLAAAVSAVLPNGWSVEPVPCDSEIGSGALPGAGLPSVGLALRFEGRGGGRRLRALATALRALPRPVIGRTVEQTLRLDLRCMEDEVAFRDQLVHLNVEPKPETKA